MKREKQKEHNEQSMEEHLQMAMEEILELNKQKYVHHIIIMYNLVNLKKRKMMMKIGIALVFIPHLRDIKCA